MKYIRYFFFTLIGLALAYVAIANRESVVVHLAPEGFNFLPALSVELPLFVVIFASMIVGVLITYFLVFGRAFAANRAKAKAETACRKAEAELEKLKRKTGETDDDVLAILK